MQAVGLILVFASTSGTTWAWGLLSSAVVAGTGSTPSFAIGALTVTAESQRPMAASLVQSTKALGSGTTVVVTLRSNVTAGNALIAMIGNQNDSSYLNSLTGGGVTWTKIVESETVGGSTEIWSGLSSTGGTKTITGTPKANATTAEMYVLEVSGITGLDSGSTSPWGGYIADTQVNPTGFGPYPLTSMNITPSQTGDFVVTLANCTNSPTPTGLTVGGTAGTYLSESN